MTETIPLRVLFRTDASQAIGTGHVMRCLALAAALKARGATVEFVSRRHAGHLCGLTESRGFQTFGLGSPLGHFDLDGPVHASWLGADWESDATETLAAINSTESRPEWLIIDHYSIDARWEQRVRGAVNRIMVIDDLADRPHDTELLLDQNLVNNLNHRYAGLVSERCGLMLGPRYALLDPAYARMQKQVSSRDGAVQRIMIYFGGSDQYGLTRMSVEAFLQLGRDDIALDVVLGSNCPHENEIVALLQGRLNAKLHKNLPNLSSVMMMADLAIGATGITSWERLCLRLPALVITVAKNQREVAESLHQRGLVHWIGDAAEVTAQRLKNAIEQFVNNGVRLEGFNEDHPAIDGRGIDRVCAALTVNGNTVLRARLAQPHDEQVTYEWANDPVKRKSGFSPDTIPAETHKRWFHQRIRNDSGIRFFILETDDGIPIGQVRFEREANGWEVHYGLASAFRGRRLGRRLLETGLMAFRADFSEADVFGRVKKSNQASRAVFESLRFVGSEAGDGHSLLFRNAQ